MRPSDRSSDLAKGVLPGELGMAKQFGAAYKSLPFSEVWDQLWRDLPGADIVVKFDKNPCSVIFWRGTNHAANWVTDNNRWMTDQSSENKVFAMFQGGYINPWGAKEQSKYVVDPFSGMWNHWPMHLIPSDGRFAVATDRVTHFSLAANDASNKFGSVVLYGFTRQPVGSLVPLARSWVRPPEVTALSGCKAADYRKESRDFPLVAEDETMSVRIAASDESPLVNPCFTVRNWGHHGAAQVKTTAAGVKDIRQGVVTDTDGTRAMVIWLDLASTSDVTVNISGAKPSAANAPQSQ